MGALVGAFPTAFARLAGLGRKARRFLRAMMREDAYEKYRAHVLASGEALGAAGCEASSVEASGEKSCGTRLMTEREFWRDQTDRQERNPQGRCC